MTPNSCIIGFRSDGHTYVIRWNANNPTGISAVLDKWLGAELINEADLMTATLMAFEITMAAREAMA